MSTLPGGAGDKAGIFHESLWGVHAMLMLLHGQADSMRIEEPRKDGAEFYLQRGSVREYWQCKRHLLSQSNWSLQKLKTEGVLDFFLECTRLGQKVVFASITDAPELRALAENSRAAADYNEYREAFLGGDRSAHFSDLCKLLDLADEEAAFCFLREVDVSPVGERFLNESNRNGLSATYSGSSAAAVAVLQMFYIASVHKTLTAADIETHLKENGIVRRLAVVSDKLQGEIGAITAAYLSGQKSKLIGGGEPIPRQVSADWLEKLKISDSSLNLFITGPAGGGKSGCLYEIVKGMADASLPVLAFRLDRVKPVISTIALGEELHLPDSPAVSLARAFPNRPIIMVVDQLDFVSTTSGRNPDFFDTLSALCDEVRGLRQYQTVHLVLACREFDFEHDHRFRQFLAKDEKPVLISRFTVDEVRQIIGAAATRLSPRQLELLTLPQNLALFVESGLPSVEQPAFVTQKELFDAYWNAKQTEVTKRRPGDAQLWLPLIEKLTAEMSEKQDLSVPKSKLDEFPPDFVTLMVSEGVLTWDGRRYGFGHESFFDYCFARRAVEADVEFVAVLEADMDQQHLFRRAQLRQVLVYLREADFDRYLKNVEHALNSDRIRPHLKLLILDLMANFPDPEDREFELLLPRIESELAIRKAGGTNPDKLASRAFDAFYSSRNLFLVADRLGHLSRWLNSGEPWLVNLMIMYLRWQVENHAERVAEIIEPFVGIDDEWGKRLRYMMEWGNLDKHRRYFDLFLVLLEDGTLDEARDRFISNGTFWNMLHGLSKNRPAWCAEVAGKWLARQVVRSKTEADGVKLMQLHDSSGVHELYAMAGRAPEAVLDHVLPAVIQAAEAWPRPFREGLPTDNIWLWRTGGEFIGMDRAFPGVCGTAFEELAKADPEKMRPAIARLRASRCDSANHLLMDAYLQAPVVFAEEAMLLLADERERLFCGFPGAPVWVSCCLIKACSPHCSAPTFEKLEIVLREFVSVYENGENGEKYRGHLAYNLCSALPVERTTPETKAKVSEWVLRFKAPDAAPPMARAYWKVSPISKEAATSFTDDQWLQAITTYNTERGEFNPEHPEYGGSIQLSGVMGELMKGSPERFARLGLRLPLDAEMYYWTTILRGAVSPGVSDDLKLELAQRAFDFPDQGRLKAALDLLAGVVTSRLSEAAIAFIHRMATHVDSSTESEADDLDSSSSDLLITGINTIRGNASHTICELICHDRSYAEIFREAIDQLAADPDIAVRAAACGLLLPLANIDIPRAFALLDKLAQPDERLLESGQAEEFLLVYLESQSDLVRPYIVRMMQSPHVDVRKAGAQFACLAKLYHEGDTENAGLAMAGDPALRRGACEVARLNLASSSCSEWCIQALTQFFSDEEAELRRLAAGGFWCLWQKPEESLLPYAGLMETFIMSPAFAEDPSYLFHALEDNRLQLPDVVLDACRAFIERCTSQARDIRTSFSSQADSVSTLIFRAYAQLRKPELRMQALSLIDMMCLEGLQSAGKKLVDFER